MDFAVAVHLREVNFTVETILPTYFSSQTIRQARISIRGFLVVMALLLESCYAITVAQNNPIALQHIYFKDKVLANNLGGFCKEVKAKAVRLRVTRWDDGFLYHLSKIEFADFIEDWPATHWGQWQDKIVLFYSGANLDGICTITDTVPYKNLVQYSKTILPQIPPPPPHKFDPKHKRVWIKYGALDGLEWTFRVINGREVFFRNNQGYDSEEDVPDVLPKVPDNDL